MSCKIFEGSIQIALRTNAQLVAGDPLLLPGQGVIDTDNNTWRVNLDPVNSANWSTLTDFNFQTPGGGSKHVIQDEGLDETARTNLNFVGAAVSVADNPGNDSSDVTISALANIVEDLSPQLGADLDMNSFSLVWQSLTDFISWAAGTLSITAATAIQLNATQTQVFTLLSLNPTGGVAPILNIQDGSGGGYIQLKGVNTQTGNPYEIILPDNTPTSGTKYLRFAVSTNLGVNTFTGSFEDAPGGGDMLISVYDPTAVSGDAFDMDNMIEGSANLILTVAERAEIAANTLKISYTDAAAVALNTTHRTSNGSDHSFIDQDVTSGSSPTLNAANISGVLISASTGTKAEFDVACSDGNFLYVGDAPTAHTHTESEISDLGTAIALVADKLDVFAATTSAELKTVISDETGSGALVFATSPTLVTPALGTPASGVLNNCTTNTESAGDNSTQLASTAYVDNQVDIKPESFIIACSDEATALTTGTAKATFRMPYAFTVTDVRASLTTAGTGAALVTVDINDGGTTILSTKITIDATEKTSTTAATPAVISDSALADDAEITIDIDQIDTGGVSAGLKVYIIGHQ